MPLTPEALAILEGVKAANELIEIFKKRLDDTDRSVLVEIDNLTDVELRKVNDSHEFGGFDQTPEPLVKKKSHSLFTSQNTAPLQGTEGCVTYVGDGIDNMTVCWDNPFAGSNAVSVKLLGRRENAFSLESTVGSGNVAAHMRFVLFDVPGPYSLKGFLERFDTNFFIRRPGDPDELEIDKGSGRRVIAFFRVKHPDVVGGSIRELMKV